MNLKLDRIISIATLLAALTAIILVLKRPAPVATPQAPAVAQQTQSTAQPGPSPQSQQSTPFSGPTTVGTTTSETASPMSPTNSHPSASSQASAKPDAAVNSDQVSSAIAKMLGGGGLANLTADSNVGSGDPVIKDQQVTMDGDIVHGKFLTTIAGKDVWVTISGHMGEKDGYATFDPTEFKVGDMEVPVSLVNPALQRKLAEERDRLKIPNGSN